MVSNVEPVDGIGISRAVAICDGCGRRSDPVPCAYDRGSSNAREVYAKMANLGWVVTGATLRCMKCEAKRKADAAKGKARPAAVHMQPAGDPDVQAGSWCVLYVRGGKSVVPLRFRQRGEDGDLTKEGRRDFNEFIVTKRLTAMGIEVWCGRKIEFIRTGKRRRAEPRERPYLRNYVFARIPAGRLFDVLSIPRVAQTVHYMLPALVRQMNSFRLAADEEYVNAQRIVANQDVAAMSAYRPGQTLRHMTLGLEGQLVTFRRLVERSFDMHPLVEVEVQAMGRSVRMLADPLDVRAAD